MAAARFIILAISCFLAIGVSIAKPSYESRILGGEDVKSGSLPWVSSVRIKGIHECVGAIISNKHVLTTGSCVSQLGANPIDVKQVTVRVGSINQYAGGQIVEASAIKIHPSYGNFLHDMAIITLAKELNFDDKINKIDVAPEDHQIAEGTKVSVAGWGLSSAGVTPYKLQHATLSALSGPECEARAGFGYQSVLCLEHAKGEGVCPGDYGAPVEADNLLVGTVSFAFGSCGTAYPDVASRTSYYSEWIHSQISEE